MIEKMELEFCTFIIENSTHITFMYIWNLNYSYIAKDLPKNLTKFM
jgi:hypothetical protein